MYIYIYVMTGIMTVIAVGAAIIITQFCLGNVGFIDIFLNTHIRRTKFFF